MTDWRDCRLLIGITSNHDRLDKNFLWDTLVMEKPTLNYITIVGKHIKSDSLNRIVEKGSSVDCDKILFMDVDMEFPIDTIPRLISHNLPIVGGHYHIKTYPFSPIAGWNREDGIRVNGRGKMWKHDYFPLPENQLVQVDWTGMGCLLVDMDVFRNINFPCFWDKWSPKRGTRDCGHDLIFFDAIREAGYKAFIDTSIDCGHRTNLVVDRLWVKAFYEANMVEAVKRILKAEDIDKKTSHKDWKQIIEGKEKGAKIDEIVRNPETVEYWDFRWEEDRIYKRAKDRRDLFYAISKYVPEQVSVGDFGCGCSTLLVDFKSVKNCDVYGYDFSPECIKWLEERELQGEIADIRNYNPNGRKHHTMIFSHILEHLRDEHIDKALKTISDMTEYQAFVVVPQEKEGIKASWSKEHKRIYNEDMLRKQVEPYFDKVDIYKISPPPKLEKAFVYRHLIAHCFKNG